MGERYQIFSKVNCPWCVKAKKLLDDRGLWYDVKMIPDDISRDDFIAMMTLHGISKPTVPQVFWNGRHVGGYEELAAELDLYHY
jgi:glutaredoxin